MSTPTPTPTPTPIDAVLTELADKKLEVQVRLRDSDVQPRPLGPGLLERHPTIAGIYRIMVQVDIQVPGSSAPPTRAKAPFLFSAADVLWISEPPVREEIPRIVPVGKGGMIIGGGS